MWYDGKGDDDGMTVKSIMAEFYVAVVLLNIQYWV